MKTKKFLSLFIFLLITSTTTGNAAKVTSENCPTGTLFEPNKNICSEIRDLTQVYSQELIWTDQNSLQDESEQNTPQIDREIDDLPMPFPGDPSAGIEYKLGTLQALEHSRFVTKMFVHEEGLEASGPVDFLFTVIGGRVQKGIEPVGIYTDNPDGTLGLFDWSCSEEFPCQNGESGPSWVLIKSFSDLSCNLTDIIDKGNHKQTIVLASNDSSKISNESPPRWSNQFYLWNYCDNSWDLVYQHEYRIDQQDCSVTFTNCARYANWIETFANPLPQINEVGFEDAMIFHDGNWSVLNTDNSRFFNDVSQWETFHLQPDQSYGVGNFTNDPPAPILTIALVKNQIAALKADSLNLVSDRPVRITANARLAQAKQYYNIAAANYRQGKKSIGNRYFILAIALLTKFKETLERGVRLNKFPESEVSPLLNEADLIIMNIQQLMNQ